MFNDNFFKRIEKKTNISKQTILDLASKLQQSDLKNETTLREVIRELGISRTCYYRLYNK